MIRARQWFPCGLRSDPLATLARLRRFFPHELGPLVALAALLVGLPTGLSAQRDTAAAGDDWGGVSVNAAESQHNGARPPDFLFERPRGALSLRIGGLFPRAGSDIFSFSERELTLKHSDFYTPLMGAGFAFRVASQVDLLFDAAYSRSSTLSEYRAYLDNNDRPIQQWTRFIQLPLTAGFRAYLTPRGRQIGHFAWVPRKVTPFVGAAAGFVWHRFTQTGDFVDTQSANLDVFTDTYTSQHWSPTAQLLGGTDMALGRHTALTVEARYGFASAHMGADFECAPGSASTCQSFQPIDLAGLQTTVGFSWRY
jgi:hypothetical protein